MSATCSRHWTRCYRRACEHTLYSTFCYYTSSNLFLRFATRSSRFTDAYEKGASRKLAVWANKQYSGHRVIPPEALMGKFEN
ncbi:hypothetical protein FIBSPDRAFT_727373 [Athelia psychrophila]|uniref:Uncharacterized protein n=1 Tax=Athelia psychrophila TaxID=1759441 RepID=A0A166SLZ2_9AGAM|nr:hypothetical protein FIBSPDRAFT_727373 [Fibularhizoctonia sp. CBS 109695]